MKEKSDKDQIKEKKGPVIPAGTEQETGLTRGKTEKPDAPKPQSPERADKSAEDAN